MAETLRLFQCRSMRISWRKRTSGATYGQQGEAGDEVDRLSGCPPRVLSKLAAEDREAIEWCDLGGVTQAQSAE